MPMRYRRRIGLRRAPRPRYTWVRDHIHNTGPVNPNTNDLLANWKTSSGMLFNVIDYTIWRIRIQVSISIHLTAATYNSQDGVFCGAYVESKNIAAFATGPQTNQYDERYLVWNNLYLSEVLMNNPFAAVTTANTYMLYKEYDVRSHVKPTSEQDTVFFQLEADGNVVMDTFDLTYTILLRHR